MVVNHAKNSPVSDDEEEQEKMYAANARSFLNEDRNIVNPEEQNVYHNPSAYYYCPVMHPI